jgi:hypothetical protein
MPPAERILKWTHRMCGDCWLAKNYSKTPEGEVEVRLPLMTKEPPGECCFCGNKTVLGIFVRHDPLKLTCSHD